MKILDSKIVFFTTMMLLGCSDNFQKDIPIEKELSNLDTGYFYDEKGDSTKQYEVRFFSKNKSDYLYEEYHQNGETSSVCLYEDNKLVKIYVVKDSSGNRLDFGRIDNGNGKVRSYYADGTIKFEGEYVNGCREGLWKEYTYQGLLNDSCFYKDGICEENGLIEYNKY